MRRYLLATTLSFNSLATLSAQAHAAPQALPERAFEVAQAMEVRPALGGEQRPPRERKDGGEAPGGGAKPAPHGQEAPNAPPEHQERRHERRDRADEGTGRGQPPHAPQPAADGQPEERRQRRGDHAEGRDQERREPAHPAPSQGAPESAPVVLPSPRGEEERGERRSRHERVREEARPVDEPPHEARTPVAPPAHAPLPPPAPAAQGHDTDERGRHRDRRDREGAGRPDRPEQRHEQAQPVPPPVAPVPQPGVGIPPPPPAQAGTPARGQGPRDLHQLGGRGSIEEIRRQRHERIEEGGRRTIIEEPGNRVIVQEKGAPAMIRHDEAERLSRSARDVRHEHRPDGGDLTIAIRPGGIEVFSEFDSGGRLMRRYRRDRDGREWNLIDNRRFRREDPVIFDMPPPRLHIPRERYIVDYDRASDDDLYDTLMDGPVDRLERSYSLDEIRYNAYLRDRMRRIDLDTVNFEFGAWQVPYDQYGRLERIAGIINRILDRHPDEVFLIEGHTDAVGSEIDNLTLSDRRAEEVAVILTQTFRVPPENLITQGYGEEYLKIPTSGPERANRRVAVRRITPLLARDR